MSKSENPALSCGQTEDDPTHTVSMDDFNALLAASKDFPLAEPPPALLEFLLQYEADAEAGK